MSQATRIAIVAAMEADTALVALLGKDPADGTSPAIFNGHKNQAPTVYNCLTYRVQTQAPDRRFRPPINAGGGSSTVQDEYFEMEVWTDKPDSADIEAIAARLSALFDNQTLTTSGGGRIFRSELVSGQPDLYDDKLNAWYGLFLFRLRIQR